MAKIKKKTIGAKELFVSPVMNTAGLCLKLPQS